MATHNSPPGCRDVVPHKTLYRASASLRRLVASHVDFNSRKSRGPKPDARDETLHQGSNMVLCTVMLLVLILVLPSVAAVSVTVVNQPTNARITVNYSNAVLLSTIRLTHPNNLGQPPDFALTPSPPSTLQSSFRFVTQAPLPAGGYDLYLDASDASGNIVRDVVSFSIDGVTIEPISPLCGVSTTQTGALSFRTRKNISGNVSNANTYCQYNGASTDTTATSTHTVNVAFRSTLTVNCSENKAGGALIGQVATATWNLSSDTTAPVISNVTLSPPTLSDASEPSVQVSFTTDDLSACSVQGVNGTTVLEDAAVCGEYTNNHMVTLSGFDTSVLNQTDYLHTVTCKNLAQRTTTGAFNVTTNFGDGVTMRKLSPKDFLAGDATFPLDLVIKPLLADVSLAPVGTCYVNANDASTCAQLASDTVHAMQVTTDPTTPAPPFEHTAAYSASFTKGATGFSEGNNTLRVRCCLVKGGKTLDARENFTIRLDSIPPTGPGIRADGAVCSGKLTATFVSSDKGTDIALYQYTATYDGTVLASGNTTSSSVTINAPAPASTVPLYDPLKQLTWDVTAYDGAGNSATNSSVVTIHDGTEDECTSTPFITLLGPAPLGFSQTKPYDFVVATKRASTCRYGPQNTDETRFVRFPTTGSIRHELRGLLAPDISYSVVCAENGKTHRGTFRIGYNAVPPTLTVTATPSVVVDRADSIVTLTVHSDDPTQCVITGRGTVGNLFDGESLLNRSGPDSYLQDHVIALRFDDIPDDAQQSFTYGIMCANLAQRNASANKQITVFFGANMTISVVSPPSYIATSTATLSVQPDRPAMCTWTTGGGSPQPFDTIAAGIHSTPLQQLRDGSHDYLISCISSDVRNIGIANAQFSVDTSVPVLTSVSGPAIICSGASQQYTLVMDTADTNPAIEYVIEDAGGSGATFQASPSNSVITIDPGGMPAGQYQLTVRIVTRANVTSQPVTKDIQVTDSSNEICQRTPHCRNLDKDVDEEGVDCGGADCRVCEQCGQVPCPSGVTCTCSGGDQCIEGFCVFIDSLAPTAPEISAQAIFCDGVVNATFNASDAGGIKSYNYTLQDDTRIIARGQTLGGTARVTLPLGGITGSLRWSAFATDTSGNDGPETTIALDDVREGEDEECGRPPFITLRKPALGFALSSPYTLELGTMRAAECRMGTRQAAFSILRPLTTTDQLVHQLGGLTFTDQDLFVSCRETAGSYLGKLRNKTIRIGVDASAPELTVLATPNPVVDRADMANVTLSVTTDDDTYCTVNNGPMDESIQGRPSTYNTLHEKSFDLTTTVLTDNPVDIPVQITCNNLANLATSTQYRIRVHLGANITIQILSPAIPPGYVAANPVELRVRANKQGDCRWKEISATSDNTFSSVSGTEYSQDLGTLTDGVHEYLITCTAIDASQGSASARFTVDTAAPTVTLTGPSVLCEGRPSTIYVVSVTTSDAKPNVTYELSGPSSSVTRNVTGGTFTIDQAALGVGSYDLSVIATTSAGIRSSPAHLSLEVAASSDERCSAPQNHCINGIQDDDETGVDCGGERCAACVSCTGSATTACVNGQTCEGGNCACDAGKAACGNNCIDVTTDTNNCGACGSVCAGQCSDGVCIPENLCANHLKDAGEEGIDCGGTCPGICTNCTATSMCDTGQTCKSGVCICDIGEELCGTTCVKIGSDEQNCGACGMACGTSTLCTSGICCGSSTTACLGQCVDLSIESQNCGACANACTSVTTCSSGACTGCTVETDCQSTQSCVQEICIVPHCANNKQDDDEQGIDCGGATCSACVACTTSEECGTHQDCVENVCVATNTCESSIECDITEDCVEGTCQGTGNCVTNDNCEVGLVCESGACVQPTSCSLESPCVDGRECQDGVCIGLPDGMQEPDACSNYQLDGDETDVDCGGSCAACGVITTTEPEPAQPAPTKSDLLAFLLVAIGLAVMGGSGYFLYEENEVKRYDARQAANAAVVAGRQQPSMRPTITGSPPVMPLSPQLQAQYQRDAAARQAALEEAYRKRQEERATARKDLFKGFDSTTAAPSSSAGSATKAADATKGSSAKPDGTPPPANTQDTPAAKEGGTTTTSAASKGESSTKDANTTKDDDAFIALDKIGKKK